MVLIKRDRRVTERRVVFKIGDFIQYRGTDLGRIQEVLIHTEDVTMIRRAFLKVLKVDLTSPERRDPVLDLVLRRLVASDTIELVGLPSVSAKKIYMVPMPSTAIEEVQEVEEVDLGADDGNDWEDVGGMVGQEEVDFMEVPWTVQFL